MTSNSSIKKKRAEERKAEAQALHDTLTAQVEVLATSDQWARFVNFATSFHQYSLNNLLLILAQNPDATHVAGYTKWQQLGRQVKKGEHGIRIFATATRRTTKSDDSDNRSEDTDQTDEAEGMGRVRYYPVVSVFDITQTEPLEGAEPIPETVQQLTGDDDHGITTPITAYLTEQGWCVESEPMQGACTGYTDPTTHRVAIRTHVSDAQYAKTLLHETAHIVLGHTDTPTEYVLHRGRMETEAESVAHITAALVGLNTSSYSVGYITGWSNGDTTVIRDTAARVLTTVHQLAELLDLQ